MLSKKYEVVLRKQTHSVSLNTHTQKPHDFQKIFVQYFSFFAYSLKNQVVTISRLWLLNLHTDLSLTVTEVIKLSSLLLNFSVQDPYPGGL